MSTKKKCCEDCKKGKIGQNQACQAKLMLKKIKEQREKKKEI